MEDCLKAVQPHKQVGEELVPIETYDFDALRHKLGLEYVSADPPKVNVPAEARAAEPRSGEQARVTDASPTTAQPAAEPKKRDIGSMNAGELSELDVAALSVGELEQAMRAALKIDARELAVAFAQAGVTKPHDAGHARPLPALRRRDHRRLGDRRPATAPWNWPSRARSTTPSTTAAAGRSSSA